MAGISGHGVGRLLLLGLEPQDVETFFQSVRSAFDRNQSRASGMGTVVLGVVAASVVYALARAPVRRWQEQRARARAFLELCRDRRLSREDAALVDRLSRHVGTSAVLVATHVDVFERATAAELRGLPPTLLVREGDLFAQIRGLRERLGFAERAAHEPLLTTRELAPGARVDVAGQRSRIEEVTEAFFSVVVPEHVEALLGVKIPLAVLHEHEAGHSVACALLLEEPVSAGFKLFLSHDEHPTSAQRRRFVRIPSDGPIRLDVPGRREGDPAVHVEGTLLDVSLHGAALTVREKIAVRSRVRASFGFGNELFRNVDALVLDCQGPPDGPFRLRLEYSKLSAADDRRLAAAVAHASSRKSAPESLARPSARAR